MAQKPLNKKTQNEQVQDRLLKYIHSPNRKEGERLASVRTLAQQFDTSPTTVKYALAEMEKRGYVERRPRSGTFIASRYRALTMADVVAVCTEIRAHVWGDLTAMLLQSLNAQQRVVTLIDSQASDAAELVRRVSHSDINCMIVHGTAHFAWDVFEHPTFKHKPVLGLIEWESPLELPELYRVLVDHQAAARLVADHLWDLGHRRLLVLGTRSDVGLFNAQGHGHRVRYIRYLVDHWQSLGGEHEILASDTRGNDVLVDQAAILNHLAGRNACTAIAGTRDVEVFMAQRLIRHNKPRLLDRVAMVGRHDTPWSIAGDPTITTVSLDLPGVVAATMDTLNSLANDSHRAKRTHHVKPQLIVRDSSIRKP